MMLVSPALRFFRQMPLKRSLAVCFIIGGVAGAWAFGGGNVLSKFFEWGCGSAPVARKFCVATNAAPHVTMTAPPALAENRFLLLSYDASDISSVKEIVLRVTPQNSMPGASSKPVDISLPVPPSKRILRTDTQDLSSYPWAGQAVTLQIVATNEGGKKGETEAFTFTLPERRFYHPIARVLIEARKKLLQNPDDEALREEAANIMATIAHDPTNYRSDPVVLMALRSGAVRLILGRDRESAIVVNDILWQAAARIEDWRPVVSQRM